MGLSSMKSVDVLNGNNNCLCAVKLNHNFSLTLVKTVCKSGGYLNIKVRNFFLIYADLRDFYLLPPT